MKKIENLPIENTNMLLRTLTMKSKIGFGLYKDCTVSDMFIMGKENELIKIYYKLEKINFNAEILEKLNIPNEILLKKPQKNYSLISVYWNYINTIILHKYGEEHLNEKYKLINIKAKAKRISFANRLENRVNRLSSKSVLKNQNQKN